MLSCWVSALSTCLARYPLSPVPCSSSALPAALSTCGHCPPALCRIVPSCELWEVAEDALLNLTVLFIFQSQKDLNSKIRVIRRGRKTTESLLKQAFQATLAIRALEALGCLFSRGGVVDCPHHERSVNGLQIAKISFVCPRAPVKPREGSTLNVVFVFLIQQQKSSPAAWDTSRYKARHLGSGESMLQHKVVQQLLQILYRAILGQWERKLGKGIAYSGLYTKNDCKKFFRHAFHRTDLAS